MQMGMWLLQIALYSQLATEVLNRRAAKQYDEKSLMLAGKLLEQNPELYTIWNYRKEALQSKLQVCCHVRRNESIFMSTLMLALSLAASVAHSVGFAVPCDK